MTVSAVLAIFLRWMHVATACVVVGGVFFMRIILPAALAKLDEPQRHATFLRCRRGMKMVVHSAILLLLVSGGYNFVHLGPQYRLDNLAQALIGVHILLALGAFTLALCLLSASDVPVERRPSHRRWMLVNLILLLALIAVASTVKYLREVRLAAALPAAAATATEGGGGGGGGGQSIRPEPYGK